jgi:hypothetical protein
MSMTAGPTEAQRETCLWVEAEQMPGIRRKLEALSRRGVRLGTGPIELQELREDAGRVELRIRGATPRLAGYRIAATLRHEGGQTIVEPVPGEEQLAESRWAAAQPWCEHCGVRRRRHITYLLRCCGDVIQVGSSCLADFTGERDPVRAVRQAELLAQARREARRASVAVDEARGHLAALEEFLATVGEIVREEGFRSRRRARDACLQATAEIAWSRLQEVPPTDTARARVGPVIKWARSELAARVERSEYEDRLVWAMSRPRIARAERYLVASALGAHARAVDPYVGEPGERIELGAWVEVASRRPREGRFGRSYMHRLRDGFGRLVVWFATDRRLERGARYRLRGTVRRHATFGGESATVVHRCRATREDGGGWDGG